MRDQYQLEMKDNPDDNLMRQYIKHQSHYNLRDTEFDTALSRHPLNFRRSIRFLKTLKKLSPSLDLLMPFGNLIRLIRFAQGRCVIPLLFPICFHEIN